MADVKVKVPGKVGVVDFGTSGADNDLTILDDKGRVWIYAVNKWVHTVDIPDEPDTENLMESIAKIS
jgi:hypothetical protein